LEKADVQKEFINKLKEYRKDAQWKGFRKGTAPLPFVKKMVGNQIFHEMVEKMTSTALFDKIDEDKINYIGNPIAVEDETTLSIKMDMEEDIKFAFDLAVMPDVEIKEPSKKVFDFFKVNNLSEVAKKELGQAQISMGKEEPTDAKFDDSVVLSIKLSELDGNKAKESENNKGFKKHSYAEGKPVSDSFDDKNEYDYDESSMTEEFDFEERELALSENASANQDSQDQKESMINDDSMPTQSTDTEKAGEKPVDKSGSKE